MDLSVLPRDANANAASIYRRAYRSGRSLSAGRTKNRASSLARCGLEEDARWAKTGRLLVIGLADDRRYLYWLYVRFSIDSTPAMIVFEYV